MKISIPLSAIYKSKYNEEYDTLQSFQENFFTNGWNGMDYSTLEYTMTEYMQDEREQATNLIIKHLPSNLKHLTPSHLNDEPYKEHIDRAFVCAMDSAYMNSYIDEYTEKYKRLAFENLEKLLDHLYINTKKLSLYTEKSKYIEESTTKIKDLSDIDRPEIWDTTHIQITLTKPEAIKIANDFNTYNEPMTMKNTSDDIADYVYDAIMDELSTTYVDTEHIDRYGSLGDYDNTLEVFEDNHLHDAIEEITNTATIEAQEQDATQELHDAIQHSTLFDTVEPYYLGQTDPLTVTHNGKQFNITVSLIK